MFAEGFSVLQSTTIETAPRSETDFRAIRVKPLNPTIGAEITGVDPSKPISGEVAAELRQAIADHIVVFLRDTPLDFAAHQRLAAVFGEAHVAPSTADWRVEGFPEITKMHADGTSKYVAGEHWHSDMSADPEPPMGSVLYLHTIPTLGGDTVFANMYAAWDALSDTMRTMLDGLTATHDAVKAFGAMSRATWSCPARHTRSLGPIR